MPLACPILLFLFIQGKKKEYERTSSSLWIASYLYMYPKLIRLMQNNAFKPFLLFFTSESSRNVVKINFRDVY